jgi:TolB protein
MFLKKNKILWRLFFLIVFLCLAYPLELLAADSNVRIEMERATSKEVRIALTQFVLGEGIGDPKGLGMEARKVLENDLRLTEMFVQLKPEVYISLEQKEKGTRKVDLWAWHQVGAQWLIKTEYSVIPGGKLSLVFRLYDTVNEKFLLGKRYFISEKKLVRKVIHRFADELILLLTGKRGVAETQIAFLSRQSNGTEIYVVDFDGENLKQMTSDKTLNLTPTWSPNGRWLAYTSYAGNNPDLVMIDNFGEKPKRTLLYLSGLNSAPSWSPVDDRLTLVLSKDENSEIYTLSNNRTLRRLTRHFNIDTSPTWSPDGKKIAFTSDRSGRGAPQIYIMDAHDGDKAGVQRISFDSSYNDNPAWSPDGDKIAYTSRVGKRFQIKIYDLTAKSSVVLTNGRGNNEQPTWSPDGRFIAYRHKEGSNMSTYIQRLDSNMTRQLSVGNDSGASPSWSPYLNR